MGQAPSPRLECPQEQVLLSTRRGGQRSPDGQDAPVFPPRMEQMESMEKHSGALLQQGSTNNSQIWPQRHAHGGGEHSHKA